jgi:ribose transport system permease protein
MNWRLTNATTRRDRSGRSRRDRLKDVTPPIVVGAAVLILWAYLSVAFPVFLTAHNLFSLAIQWVVIGVIAIGMTLVMSVGGIDLSMGSVAALSGVGGAIMMTKLGLPPVAAMAAACLLGVVAGTVNGVLVAFARVVPFIATLGMLSVARGSALVLAGGAAVVGLPDSFRLLGQGVIGVVPVALLTLVAVGLAGQLVLARIRPDRQPHAAGSDAESAPPAGGPKGHPYQTLVVYVVAGALAALGGIIAASWVNSGQPYFGIGLELEALAVALIGGASLRGGKGTVLGTLIVAFLAALVHNAAVFLRMSVAAHSVIVGIVVWLAASWDQFRGRQQREPSNAQAARRRNAG